MLLVKKYLSISTDEDVLQIRVLQQHCCTNIKHLLKDNKSRKDSMQNLTRQKIFEDGGFNSEVSN